MPDGRTALYPARLRGLAQSMLKIRHTDQLLAVLCPCLPTWDTRLQVCAASLCVVVRSSSSPVLQVLCSHRIIFERPSKRYSCDYFECSLQVIVVIAHRTAVR